MNRSVNYLKVVIMVILSSISFAAKAQVSGTVYDENKFPLPGVNISLNGSNQGTITNLDGEFVMEAANPQNDSLTFSFLGYKTQTIALSGREWLEVTLEPATNALQEVVVVGYGSQKKSDVTGAVASADIEAFRNAPNTNIAQSLQGTVPGLNVGQVTSAGATPAISIRGQSTISGNSNVLIVLDGVQYDGSLSALNPDDIASIDVLKDASSTAVYGAQAANGVVLITTKKGKNRKPRISLSSSITTQSPNVEFEPMGKEEYLNYIRDFYYEEAYLAPDFTQLNPDFDVVSKVDPIMKDENGNLLDNNFNWWDAATDKGFVKDVKASISGGSERTRYLFSLGFTEQQGFIKNDEFQRKSIRLNLESDVTDWWTVGIQSFGSFVNTDGAQPNLAEIIRQSPLLVPYDEEGNLIPYPFNTKDLNPFINYDVDDYDRQNYFFSNIYSEIDLPFLEGLSYRVNLGNNYKISKHFWASEYGAGLIGAAYKHHDEYFDYTLDNVLRYDRIFGKHDFGVTLLYGARERQDSYTSASAQGFTRLTLGYNSLQQGEEQFSDSSAWSESMLYQMARVNYKFDEKYLFTGTIRRDGFSGFADNHKFGYFPSAAVGWIVSNEDFMKVDWVNDLKIRAGYGVSGNQTSRYKSLATISSYPGYVFGDGGTTAFRQTINTLANPNLKWERTTGFNLGLDFTLLDYRLEGTVDYYRDITNDLLFDVALPYISGFDQISTNIGRLKNQGIEVSLTSTNINTEDFRWTSSLSFSTNSNEILELTNQDLDGDGQEDDLVTSNLFIGESLGAVFGYKTDGLYQIGDEIPEGFYPGTYRIVDLNQDGVINPDDRTILGKSEPAFRASLMNTLEYRNFSLNIFLNSIQGGNNSYIGFNSRPLVRNDNNIRYNNFSGVDYWSPSNPNAANPRSVGSPRITPDIYRDRSFIRLQDVTLSYRFQGKLLEQLQLQDFSLFFSGKNLATWSDWKGWDPETNQGLTIGGRPVMKAYSVGFNLSF